MKTFIPLFFLVMLTNCSSRPAKVGATFTYVLWEDPINTVLCSVVFQKDEREESKQPLEKGAKVFIDNVELRYDAFHHPHYVLERDTSTFIGKHRWMVTLPDSTTRRYSFEVVPFVITSDIPPEVGHGDLRVKCENLMNGDRVILILDGNPSPASKEPLEIKPSNGFFTIPKTFFATVPAVKIDMSFNITRKIQVINDKYFRGGVTIEWIQITKRYAVRVVR